MWDFGRSVPLRTITDARIREISLVAWPAYPTTTASVRGERPARGASVAFLQKRLRNLVVR